MRFLKYIFCALLFVTASVADTININWINGGETYAQTTCEIGGDIILPSPPTKRGHTFKGWLTKYIRLEYIESTGTQYIATDFVPIVGDEISTEYMFTDLSGDLAALYSAGTGTFQLITICSAWQNKTYIKHFRSGGALDMEHKLTVNEWYHLYINKNGVATIGEQVVSSAPQAQLDGNETNLYILMRRNLQSPFIGRLKSFVITRGTQQVLNLIPVKRHSDNAIGMFDTVTQTFFENAGTGEFIAGPVADNQNFHE